MARTTADESVLVIDDGGVESLIACLICPAPSRVVAWFPRANGPAEESRVRAARRKADLLGLAAFVEASGHTVTERGQPEIGFAATRLLLAAGVEAAARGCARVVWPAAFGDDLDAMARCVERARLVSHVLGLDLRDSGRTPVRIDTPLVDLCAPQLIDLAQDLDAPLHACWWCQADAPAPCGHCETCAQWANLRSPDQALAGSASRDRR